MCSKPVRSAGFVVLGSKPNVIIFSIFLQVCAVAVRRPSPLHDHLLGLHRGHDHQGHRPREGAPPQGGHEGHGAQQRRPLAGLVHRQLRHHVRQLHPPHPCPQGENQVVVNVEFSLAAATNSCALSLSKKNLNVSYSTVFLDHYKIHLGLLYLR